MPTPNIKEVNPINSNQNNPLKEVLFCKINGFETKEEDHIRGGYIATTHLDSGFYDESRGVFIKDKIRKETLDSWAEELKQGVPRANKASVNHNRMSHVAGVAIKDSVRIDRFDDGEYGLYTETLIDKTREDYDDVKYRLDKGLLDSHSIEFSTRDPSTGKYLFGAVNEISTGEGIIRELLPGTILEGYTLASQPMNEHAIMIKEVIFKEENKMDEEIKKVDTPVEPVVEETPIVEPVVEETTTEEITEEKEVFSKEDIKLLKEVKSLRAKEAKDKEKKELISEIKKELESKEVKNKVLNNDSPVLEKKEYREYKELFTVEGKTLTTLEQLNRAAKICEAKGLIDSFGVKPTARASLARNNTEMKFVNGRSSIEFKGLGITTNQNTDTDYLLSAAELADVFDPVIYNILNQMTTAWNLLSKEDYSTKGNNQVQFTLKVAANSTATAYTGNAVSTGNTTRLKYMTKFKKYQVGVEVDGDMIAAARGGPIGDVFSQEVMDSTDDLMAVINAALFAEVGLETASGVIGFEFVCDQAGNGTMYNLSRTQANGLASTTTADNYINGGSATVSFANLRAAKRKAVGTEGANLNNMVFITSFVQGDMFRGKYDAAQRLVPTSSRVGFEGRPSFDGIPIFEDKDCNTDDWFLVDLETHKVAIWVPPTLEMLGKTADSQKGFIKTYFATYNRAPRRMVMIYGNATS